MILLLRALVFTSATLANSSGDEGAKESHQRADKSGESGSFRSPDCSSSFVETDPANSEGEFQEGSNISASDQGSEDWSESSISASGSKSAESLTDESGRSSLGSENVLTEESSFDSEMSEPEEDHSRSENSSDSGSGSKSESDSAIDDEDDDLDEEEGDEDEEYGSSEFEGILDDDSEEEGEESICVADTSLSEDVFKVIEEKGYVGMTDEGSKALEDAASPEKTNIEAEETKEVKGNVQDIPSLESASPGKAAMISNTECSTPGNRRSFKSCSFQQLPGVSETTPKTVPLIRNSVDAVLARNICGSAEPYQRRDSPILRLFNQSTPIKSTLDFQHIPNIKMEDLIETPMSSTPKADNLSRKPPQLACEDHNVSVSHNTSHHSVTTVPNQAANPASASVRQRAVSGPASLMASSAPGGSTVQQKAEVGHEEKMQRRRAKITQEILDTEATYQQHLHLVLKVGVILIGYNNHQLWIIRS